MVFLAGGFAGALAAGLPFAGVLVDGLLRAGLGAAGFFAAVLLARGLRAGGVVFLVVTAPALLGVAASGSDPAVLLAGGL